MTFNDLHLQASLLQTEVQTHLATVVGAGTTFDGAWDLDVDSATISFASTTSDEVFSCAGYLLGSAAPGPQSWLWAWANPSGYSEQALEAVEIVRQRGEHWEIAELTNAEVPLGEYDPQTFAWRIGAVATMLLAGAPVYTFAAGGGTYGAVSMHDPRLELPPPSVVTLPRLVQQTTQAGPIASTSFHGYGQVRGVQVNELSDTEMELTYPDGVAQVTFDEQFRPINISMQAEKPQ